MPDVEQKIVTLPVDANLESEVKKLEADGWKPSVPPIMTYHLYREKAPEPEPEPYSGGALGVMRVREDLVQVFGPDGKPK